MFAAMVQVYHPGSWTDFWRSLSRLDSRFSLRLFMLKRLSLPSRGQTPYRGSQPPVSRG